MSGRESPGEAGGARGDPSPGSTGEERRGPISARISQAASEGQRVGIALGAFGLIHAGTIRFLDTARAACDRLFVAVLAQTPPSAGVCGNSTNLLRPEERVRILNLLRETDGAELVAPGGAALEEWRRAAPRAVWMISTAENDVDDSTIARLQELGATVKAIPGEGACSTRSLLARIQRRKDGT
jgi:bifunctional ADP-heptose synthase (sugar kinase/adenylyltransferase)